MPDSAPCVLHHLCLATTDLERTLAYYQQAVGLVVRREPAEIDAGAAERVWNTPGAGGRVAWGRLPGSPLLLEFVEWAVPRLSSESVPLPRRPGVEVLSFVVDDLSATQAMLVEHGLPVDSGPVIMADGTQLLFSHDPDGSRVEFIALSPR